MFRDDYFNDTECTYELDTIPNHADSKEAFWKLLKDNGERFTATEFVKSIDIWNMTSEEWMQIFGDGRDTTEEQRMFRYSIRNVI